MSWSGTTVTYYFDGVQVNQITGNLTAQPMYMILNNAPGGTQWPGPIPPGVTFPQNMYVDWVRVYQ
jgi:beta-glucanase (GH16 family)